MTVRSIETTNRPFDQFLDCLEEQDVKLVGRYAGQLDSYPSAGGSLSDQALNIRYAVIDAGRLRAAEPEEPLVDGPLSIDQAKPSDEHTLSLLRILNQSYEPKKPSPLDYTFMARGARAFGVCTNAEVGFARVFFRQDMRLRSDDVGPDNNWTIIKDPDDNPVFIRKHIGEKSSIGLVPVVVDGVEYPAGSIFAAFTEEELESGVEPTFIEGEGEDTYSSLRLKGNSGLAGLVNTYPLSALAKVRFLRLSAFAVSSAERKTYYPDPDNPGGSVWHYEGETVEDIILNTTIDEVKATAKQLLNVAK